MEEDFKKYVDYTNQNLENIINITKEKQISLNLQIWRLKSKKETYIKNNISIVKDGEEKRIYENEKENFDKRIKFLRKELEKLDDIERNDTIELEIFIDIINNAEKYYKKASYVQKGKIAKILFLNITIKSKKELTVQIRPELKTLFNPIWWWRIFWTQRTKSVVWFERFFYFWIFAIGRIPHVCELYRWVGSWIWWSIWYNWRTNHGWISR